MTHYTIRVQLEAPEAIDLPRERDGTLGKLLDKSRATFPEATSITVESDDGTSETIYTRKS
jgi:hypothetical protein